MKQLPIWSCLNKKTPHSWFEKYSKFLTQLVYELGFVKITCSDIGEIGDGLHMTFEIVHKDGSKFSFTLLRAREFAGGGIIFDQRRDKSSMFMTVSYSNGVGYESRTEVGDWVIEQIRDHWDLSLT